MQNVNVAVITGNLTRDPELRSTEGGTKVCNLRVAVTGRRRNGDGSYDNKPNYLSVTVWGAQGEACAEHLSKGRAVAVEGRLEWRESGEGDARREYVQIVASTVQFLGRPQNDRAGTDHDVSTDDEDGSGS
jgi:single-strand DNA-binding protein